MSKQRRQRSWTRLFLGSLLAGVGVAALRSLLRPAASAQSPAVSPAVTPEVTQRLAPAATSLAAPPDPDPLAQTAPPIGLIKSPAASPVTDSAEFAAARTDALAVAGAPALTFVPEPERARQYQPPAAPNGATASSWESPSASSEWLPGFGASPTLAEDPWTASPAASDSPTDVIELPSSGPMRRARVAFQEWKNQTPRSQIIYTVVGTLCIVGAVVAVIVLTV